MDGSLSAWIWEPVQDSEGERRWKVISSKTDGGQGPKVREVLCFWT